MNKPNKKFSFEIFENKIRRQSLIDAIFAKIRKIIDSPPPPLKRRFHSLIGKDDQ